MARRRKSALSQHEDPTSFLVFTKDWLSVNRRFRQPYIPLKIATAMANQYGWQPRAAMIDVVMTKLGLDRRYHDTEWKREYYYDRDASEEKTENAASDKAARIKLGLARKTFYEKGGTDWVVGNRRVGLWTLGEVETQSTGLQFVLDAAKELGITDKEQTVDKIVAQYEARPSRRTSDAEKGKSA